MARAFHPLAGTIALVTIVTFWLSTVAVEAVGTATQIAHVKTAIPWGFILLIPALAAAGGSGAAAAEGRSGTVVRRKRRRMAIAAANGLLVLVPAALFLAARARAQDFDAAFHAVQAVELAAGAVNIALLGLNFRDGRRMARPRAAARA